MWILGLILLCGLYRLLMVWYLPLWGRDRGRQPYYWSTLWYHVVIIAAVVLLLASSMFFCSRTNPWLTFLPPVVILISLYYRARKNARRLRETIRDAVWLERQLIDAGESRSAINRRLCERFLGSAPSVEWALQDDDLRTILKCWILPELGLYRIDWDLAAMKKPGAVMLGSQIDGLIDFYEDVSVAAKAVAQRTATRN